MSSKHIVFVSTMNLAPWGGSEELWSGAALSLRAMNHRVSASVRGWQQPSSHVQQLRDGGIEVSERHSDPPRLGPELVGKTIGAVRNRIALRRFARWLKKCRPDLICISTGSISDDRRLIALCVDSGRPYTIVTHANSEGLWPDEKTAQRLITNFKQARRAYFVSKANWRLLEIQLGVTLSNAEVIRNPCKIRRDISLPWPGSTEPIKFACVGRLEPRAKGQDLLLQVLSTEHWKNRKFELSLYGDGDKEAGLRRLAQQLGISDKIKFCGHEGNIERLWSNHHALVLASRYEGLPLTIVEAMFCSRPVVVTDVAGNAEIVEDGVNGFVAEAATVRHVAEAMERAWERRADWPAMGKNGATSIRQKIPEDPASVFARALLNLTE